MNGERVLLLIPHPDDELVGCAAAIGRLRKQGGQVYGFYLTTGVPATASAWFRRSEKYQRAVKRRWDEAQSVASALGLDIVGRQLVPSRELKGEISQSIASVREQVTALAIDRVWVPAYEGGHQDHDTANFIGSCLNSGQLLWEFSEYHFARRSVQNNTFIECDGREVNLSLDSEERARKRALLLEYNSEQKNLGYVGILQESFRPLVNYDYARPPHTGQMFYQRFQWVPYHPRIDYCRPEDVCHALSAGLDLQ
jgi:hypothetical protein